MSTKCPPSVHFQMILPVLYLQWTIERGTQKAPSVVFIFCKRKYGNSKRQLAALCCESGAFVLPGNRKRG